MSCDSCVSISQRGRTKRKQDSKALVDTAGTNVNNNDIMSSKWDNYSLISCTHRGIKLYYIIIILYYIILYYYINIILPLWLYCNTSHIRHRPYKWRAPFSKRKNAFTTRHSTGITHLKGLVDLSHFCVSCILHVLTIKMSYWSSLYIHHSLRCGLSKLKPF